MQCPHESQGESTACFSMLNPNPRAGPQNPVYLSCSKHAKTAHAGLRAKRSASQRGQVHNYFWIMSLSRNKKATDLCQVPIGTSGVSCGDFHWHIHMTWTCPLQFKGVHEPTDFWPKAGTPERISAELSGGRWLEELLSIPPAQQRTFSGQFRQTPFIFLPSLFLYTQNF